jgi:hypothetical protein
LSGSSKFVFNGFVTCCVNTNVLNLTDPACFSLCYDKTKYIKIEELKENISKLRWATKNSIFWYFCW